MIALALLLSLAPAGDGSVWDRLAECESGGNWSLNGTYDGGLQFAPSTWTAMGGPTQYAWQATRSQQIAVAQRLWEVQGWGAWPGCSRRLGLSGNPAADSARVDAIADSPEIDPELQPPQQAALSVLAEGDIPAEIFSGNVTPDDEALPVTE